MSNTLQEGEAGASSGQQHEGARGLTGSWGNVPGTQCARQKHAKKGGWGLEPVATMMPTGQKDTELLEILPSTESWLGLLNSHPSPLPQSDPFSCNELILSPSAQQRAALPHKAQH